MATQYLPFATAALAASASQADWAQKILKHPTLSSAVTKAFWTYIVNPNDGTALGVFTDDVMAICAQRYSAAQLSALQAALLPETDPTVIATLAALAASSPIGGK